MDDGTTDSRGRWRRRGMRGHGGGGRGNRSHHQQEDGHRPDGNRRRSRGPDVTDFERQLALQRQRQQQQPREDANEDRPSDMDTRRAPLLRGFAFDAARGRYFPASLGARRSSPPSTSSVMSSPSAPAPATMTATTPKLTSYALHHHNIVGRIREREWRHGQHLRMGAIGGLLHIKAPGRQRMVGLAAGLEDLDVEGKLIVTVARTGMVTISQTMGHSYDLFNCSSGMAAVRWRKASMSPDSSINEQSRILAVAGSGSDSSSHGGGGAGGSAVTVCKLVGDGDEDVFGNLQMNRFALGKRDIWSVEWDPWRGRRLLPGLSKGPLVLLDAEAGRQLPHPFHLSSDCFASCWGRADSHMNETVFLGLRNGQVRLVDLRAPTARAHPLATMGCVVDQLEMLAQGRGLLVSDRLGGLRLLDIRFPIPALRDFPPCSTATVASTGFVVDPFDETLCLRLTPQGVLESFDLGNTGCTSPVTIGTLLLSQASTPTESAATRFFLGRRWGESMPGALWPALTCGNRATGEVLQIDLRRKEQS